jgi:type II secretory pathway pseudopilin PulG
MPIAVAGVCVLGLIGLSIADWDGRGPIYLGIALVVLCILGGVLVATLVEAARRRARLSAQEAGGPAADSINQYAYDLIPVSADVRLRLLDSASRQSQIDVVRWAIEAGGQVLASIPARDDPRPSEPVRVSVEVDGRLLDVGGVPPGLIYAVDAALGRLVQRGADPRIPVAVEGSEGNLRIALLMGRTR